MNTENLVFCIQVKDFCCSIATAQGPSQPPGPAQNGSQNHRVQVMDLGRWRPMQVTPQKWPIPSGFWGLEGRAREGPSQPHMATPSGQHHHRAPYTMAQPSPLSSSEARVLEKGPGSHQKQLQKNIGSQFCLGIWGPAMTKQHGIPESWPKMNSKKKIEKYPYLPEKP